MPKLTLQVSAFLYAVSILSLPIVLTSQPSCATSLPLSQHASTTATTRGVKTEVRKISAALRQTVKSAERLRRVREFSIADREFNCLARNVYYEARNQSFRGKRAIADVTLNRLASDDFPKSICGVVREEDQFSWYSVSRLKSRIPSNEMSQEAWDDAQTAAKLALKKPNAIVPKSVLYYHAKRVKPSWCRKMRRITKIEEHIFYAHRR